MKATRQDFVLSIQEITTEYSCLGKPYRHHVYDVFDIKQAAIGFSSHAISSEILLLNDCITSNTTIADYNTAAIDRTDGDKYPRTIL